MMLDEPSFGLAPILVRFSKWSRALTRGVTFCWSNRTCAQRNWLTEPMSLKRQDCWRRFRRSPAFFWISSAHTWAKEETVTTGTEYRLWNFDWISVRFGALGLSLVWRFEVLNVSHGTLMLGGYASFWLSNAESDPFISIPAIIFFSSDYIVSVDILRLVVGCERSKLTSGWLWAVHHFQNIALVWTNTAQLRQCTRQSPWNSPAFGSVVSS